VCATQVKESEKQASGETGFSHSGQINATSFTMNTKNHVTWTRVVRHACQLSL
jgi:hypothetical protein